MPRCLSRVAVYGPCLSCGGECVGDSTREVGFYDQSGEWHLSGYAHEGACERAAAPGGTA